MQELNGVIGPPNQVARNVDAIPLSKSSVVRVASALVSSEMRASMYKPTTDSYRTSTQSRLAYFKVKASADLVSACFLHKDTEILFALAARHAATCLCDCRETV